MQNTIITGETISEMSKLPAESIDLIFADPPYFMQTSGILNRPEGTEFHGCNDDWDKFTSLNEYASFSKEWLTHCKRLLKPSGSIWVIGSMQCIYTIGSVMQALGFWFINDIVWQKSNPAPNFTGSRLNNSHETLLWAVKDRHSRFTFNYKTAKLLNSGKQLGSVWTFPVCSGSERLKDSQGRKIHSTQKPQALLERIIAISSKLGDTVLDPFGGTMTTAAAAKKLGRKFIMIERNETYCAYGRKRLDAVEFEDSEIARAVFDVKPIRVTMQEMIQSGAFSAGELFILKDGRVSAKLTDDGTFRDGEVLTLKDGKVSAKLTDDGTFRDGEALTLKDENVSAELTDNSTFRDSKALILQDGFVSAELQPDGKLLYHGEILDMHTCAAKAKNLRAKRINGFDVWYVLRDNQLVSISAIRENYRQSIISREE